MGIWQKGATSIAEFISQVPGYIKSVVPPVIIWILSLSLESYSVTKVPATTLALVRCLNVPCTAIFVPYTGQAALTVKQWVAVMFITVGVMMGTMASFKGKSGNLFHDESIFNIVACLSVPVLTALRFTLEGKLMKTVPPIMAMGIEGALLTLAFAVLIVGAHFWGIEDVTITWEMMEGNTLLQCRIFGCVVSNIVYTTSSILVMVLIGTVWRAVTRGLSMFGLWACQCVLFELNSGLQGEHWDSSSGCIMAAALVVTSVSTYAYSTLS